MSYTVLKFGGTSLGSPERMAEVAELVKNQEGKKIVVLSAVSGTTNQLVKLHDCHAEKNSDKADKILSDLHETYRTFIQTLLQKDDIAQKASEVIDGVFDKLSQTLKKTDACESEKYILAQGELMSTQLFAFYCQENKIAAELIWALDFMRLDKKNEPDLAFITSEISPILDKTKEDIIVTQGYICRNAENGIDNLQRGGSDYTASLVGVAVQAKEVQIWTDIDGMHNNDPRIVEKTYPVARLSFDEAAELSYFGAKILHPACIRPAQDCSIPVRILNTMAPQLKGTYISHEVTEQSIKAIAAKDDITAIKIKSSRMLLAYGFLRKVFEVFENHKTAIDMVTTSEVAVSCTIDDPQNLEVIERDLAAYGDVQTDKEQTIICVVGAKIAESNSVVSDTFSALSGIPVRMISFGGSLNNISILVDSSLKKTAMEKLNQKLFNI